MISEKFTTIVHMTSEDGSIKHFYAYVELKNGIAHFDVDNIHPLSDDEVYEFNKNNPKKLRPS